MFDHQTPSDTPQPNDTNETPTEQDNLSDKGKSVMQGQDYEAQQRFYEKEVEKWAQQAQEYKARGRHDLAEEARENMRKDSMGLEEIVKAKNKRQQQ